MESTKLRYEFMNASHVNGLRTLYHTIFGKEVDPSYFSIKYSLDSDQQQLSTVAFDGDQIIGCFGVLLQLFSNAERTEIVHLALACDFFLLPDYQGKGVFGNLYEHSRKQCESYGYTMYSFHSNQTDKVSQKWGWEYAQGISRFHAKAYPFSTSKLLRVLGLNSWRKRRLERQLSQRVSTTNLDGLNRVAGKLTGVYDESFFQSKSFCNHYQVELFGCTLWLKYDYILSAGFVHFGEGANPKRMIKELRRIARKSGIHEVVFQVHSGTEEAIGLVKYLEEKPSFPVSSLHHDGQQFDFSTVKLNFMDMDVF